MGINDVKIAGSGTISAGEYNEVVIAGSGVGVGDINCKLLKVAGSGNLEGNITAQEIKVAGSAKFMKDIKANKIKIAGSAKIEGNLSCEEFILEGCIAVSGECNAGTMHHNGEGSRFNNIYGDIIELETKKGKKVYVNEIEATNINLRSVDAKRISGEVVKVTGKSVIDVIEYKESLQISVNAVVKEIVKL